MRIGANENCRPQRPTTEYTDHTEIIFPFRVVRNTICESLSRTRKLFRARLPGLPLPSMGRGNEGDGWSGRSPPSCAIVDDVPTPLPVEGRGRIVRRSPPFVWLRRQARWVFRG